MDAQPPSEAERLEQALAALTVLKEEEPPRRLAFVSDRVFEMPWWRRWLSPPAWGMAAVAASVLMHGVLTRPLPAAPGQVTQARAEKEIDLAALEAAYERRLTLLVRRSAQESEARVRDAVAAAERRLEFQHRAAVVTLEENYSLLRKQMNRMVLASADFGGSR
jgi:hypothetical protein